YPRQHALQTKLSEFNQTMREAVMGSYTKVLFVRDPFQRLIAAYMQSVGGHRRSFSTFVQGVLDRGQHKASMEAKPLVSLCQPCLMQYDYVLMFGSLRQELGHLIERVGLPKDTHLPEFGDTQVQWAYVWLSEQLFSELSLKQKKQLAHFYREDLSAFQFSNSLLSD
ncbi:CHST8 sulfotransferase, partial [Eudromia elegans]|nr:CHST8 sulfotransferase [Eudromia elegans]